MKTAAQHAKAAVKDAVETKKPGKQEMPAGLRMRRSNRLSNRWAEPTGDDVAHMGGTTPFFPTST